MLYGQQELKFYGQGNFVLQMIITLIPLIPRTYNTKEKIIGKLQLPQRCQLHTVEDAVVK